MFASRRSRPTTIWRTVAPAEWAEPVPSFSTPRVIVSVLPATAVISTISSRAVSGSITTVNVSPEDTVIPPRSCVADTTVADVPDEVSEPESVVC